MNSYVEILLKCCSVVKNVHSMSCKSGGSFLGLVSPVTQLSTGIASGLVFHNNGKHKDRSALYL